MFDKAIQVLNIFYDNGFEAYIVGGYPRDTLLEIKTNDIDICTSAKPVQIMELFDTDGNSDMKYGSVRIIYKGFKFDVTTFRKDIKYEKNRKPIRIKYINDIKKDLLRRDFTINTLCIDRFGEFIDILNVRDDINNKIIKTVGNPRYRIKEDSLRILRAIRFSSILDFEIDVKTKSYIMKYGHLLKDLSYSRKKEELDKIFASKNKEKGRKLILELKLDEYLGLYNLNNIVMCDDIIGIWSQLDLDNGYVFSKNERLIIKNIKKMLSLDVNSYTVYKYGLYVSTVVGSIKGISYKKINDIYNNLPIYTKKDIDISGLEISDCVNSKPGNYISKIYDDIERLILIGKLNNKKKEIINYIKNNY